MENVFETITSAFQSLWQIKNYGNTLEIVTPVATINNLFVTVFITKRGDDYIATDGGWIDSGVYECDVDWDSHIFKRIGFYYLENLDIQRQSAKGRTFYYKRINKLELLPNIVFDMSSFINAIISSSRIKFTADREELTFKKDARGYMRKQFGEDRFEFDKPLYADSTIRFNAVEKTNTGINLINFVAGSNSTYFANSLCRSNTNFQMIRTLHGGSNIRRTITLLDDRKPSVINSPQVRTYYNYLLGNKTEDNCIVLWSLREELAAAI